MSDDDEMIEMMTRTGNSTLNVAAANTPINSS